MLTGLIWMVQIVHDPLFAYGGEGACCEYARQHSRRITWLVGPLMVPEAVAAIGLLLLLDTAVARLCTDVGVLLLLVAWGSTAFLRAPCHPRLSRGSDGLALRRLVGTTWIRAAAWPCAVTAAGGLESRAHSSAAWRLRIGCSGRALRPQAPRSR